MNKYIVGDKFRYKLGYSDSVITIETVPEDGIKEYGVRIDFPSGSVIYCNYSEETIDKWTSLQNPKMADPAYSKVYATNVSLSSFLRAANKNNITLENRGKTVAAWFDDFFVEVVTEHMRDEYGLQQGDLIIGFSRFDPGYIAEGTLSAQGMAFLIDVIQEWALQ